MYLYRGQGEPQGSPKPSRAKGPQSRSTGNSTEPPPGEFWWPVLALPRAACLARRREASGRRASALHFLKYKSPPHQTSPPQRERKEGNNKQTDQPRIRHSLFFPFSETRGETISVQGRRPQATFVTRGARRSPYPNKEIPPFLHAPWGAKGLPPNRQALFGPGGSRREPAPDPKGGKGGENKLAPSWRSP